MYKRKSFYVRIPLPDGAGPKHFRVKVSVYDDLLELNGHIQSKGLWPEGRYVLAFNVGYPSGDRRDKAWSHIMLARGCTDPGTIAHEGEHAVFFMMREALGINRLELKATKRFGEKFDKKSASATEEFICSSLQHLIGEIYDKAKERGVEL